MGENINDNSNISKQICPRPEHEVYTGKPIQRSDGQWFDAYGKKMTKDEAYSSMFWSKYADSDLCTRMQDSMTEILKSSFDKGMFNLFVSKSGIEQEDKERISAFRILANKSGYNLGELKFNPKSYTVSGKIDQSKK